MQSSTTAAKTSRSTRSEGDEERKPPRDMRNRLKLSRSRADGDHSDDGDDGDEPENNFSDKYREEEVANAAGRVNLEEAGLKRDQVRVLDYPPEWQDDILSFHHNERNMLDPYGPEEVCDSPPSHVVVLKVTNPVARDWNARQAKRGIYMYRREGSSGTFTTTDKALEKILGADGIARVQGELDARLAELMCKGLVVREPVDPELPEAARGFLERTAPMNVDRELFYGPAEVRLGCMKDATLPTLDELVAEYLKSHDGAGGAVAVPLSFFNRAIRRLRK